jgi:hypothetical protein
MKQLSGFISGSLTRIVGTSFSPGLSRKAGEERCPFHRERAGRKVKDDPPVLHTLIFCHSNVYTPREGVKDF